ncbi:hypothetical protein FE257_006409 [Aspergillus nanangensis]|uniref:C2 domain-containing protein n=1 Tax=Aspergillus nanangensis TaxID=2582783 RepID=A0AAD4GY48_ASPNN|nr:hypothetical protein FE257_006409 [Aspergillus nanangensis]
MSKSSKLTKVNHAAGIFADMSVDGPAIGTLVAVVDRAKNLPNRKTMGKQNPYCAARLGKEAKKTDTDLRGGQTPKWDQELRFTVHESPDYFRLKVSVFNDDKRTDMIGETWVDLRDLIIPGGGQSDQWHSLQCRGKYAGDIRLEMTYYDTRPEDEAVIERRTQGTEKVHPRPTGPAAPVSSSSLSSSLSGPRQLKDVKRRPLPTDPTGAAAPRPTLPEKAPSAPLPLQPVPRPTHHEAAHAAPPPDHGHQPRHSTTPENPYDAATYGPPTASRPARNYDTPDDLHRDWNPSPSAQHPPAGPPRRAPPEPYYPSYRERPMDAYDPRSHARPRSGYANMPPADFRASRPDPPGSRDHYPQEPLEIHAPVPEAPRPSSHHSNYHIPTAEPYISSNEGLPHGYGSRYLPRSSGGMHEPRQLEYVQNSGMVEPDHHYQSHNNSFHNTSVMRPPPSRDGYHAEYATMQPRVDDEDEEGPPPPPPVHRSGLGSQQLVPSPNSSYHAYSPEYASPRTSREITTGPLDGNSRMPELPRTTSAPSMPPSLVAGFDPIVADAESDRVAYENHSRRQSAILEVDQVMPPREPSPMLPPYPVNTAAPVSRQQALVDRRPPPSRGSIASETRIVPRKSVSPRPSSASDPSASQIPFSPDSFDAFNPNAARSAILHDSNPAYDTPSQAMEAARRSEAEAAREPGPIYDDDGKEIDPSDHLPTDTWAPEPERKNPKKPGVVVRFRNAPARNSNGPPPPAKEYGAPPRARPTMTISRRPQSNVMPEATSEMTRGRTGYGSSYGHGRTYSTPDNNVTPPPRSSHRSSVSPAPRSASRSPSSFYAEGTTGPPIPAKVPIGPATSPAFPVSGSQMGMDALSRELGTIDIGGVGCNNGRAIRRYVPKITTGYAI